MDVAGNRHFRLGANHRYVKCAHSPGCAPLSDLLRRRVNRFSMVAVPAFGIHCAHPVGHVAVSKTDLPACATNRLGGVRGFAPNN